MRPIITSTACQPGLHRYGPGFERPPHISRWRANLTALSQVQNLYFIAHGPEVHVYVPQFPTQAVGGEAVLILTTQPSAPDLPGYIDARRPHSINTLIVELLGNEEVVAAVRDDGDVDAFLVRHIVQAIARRADPSSTLSTHANELTPFFHRNVEESAWGLAIHTQARILAVSSNKHVVTIFKFGLLEPDPSRVESPEESSEGIDGPTDRKASRKADFSYEAVIGSTNIPYISFCNTGDDPECRWLLTTDISGICRAVDLHDNLHSKGDSRVFRFGLPSHDPALNYFDVHHAGWILMFLDRRSFQLCDDLPSALGADNEDVRSILRDPHAWDLSHTVRRLTGHSLPLMQRDTGPEGGPGVLPQDEISGTSSLAEVEDSVDGSGGGVQLDSMSYMESDGSEFWVDEDASSDSIQPHSSDDQQHLETPSPPASDLDHRGSTSNITGSRVLSDAESVMEAGDAEDLAYGDLDDDDDLDIEPEPHSTNQSASTIGSNNLYYSDGNPKLCDHLPCPLIHSSVRNIYLLQPSSESKSMDGSLIGLANPFAQPIHPDFDFLHHFERINMSAYIPPLGVVVMASQKGRAIILALTKISLAPPHSKAGAQSKKDNNKSPSASRASPTRYTGQDRKSTYTMRVECIVPFPEQERENRRPLAPLHGIAVSPLQRGPEEQRGMEGRWRLMMMYQDHTILSYEISRGGKGSAAAWVRAYGSAGAVRLEDLVV